MPTFRVSLKEMPPQKTRTGKNKLDRWGNPLSSVQVRQDFSQRVEMTKIIENVCRIFSEQPDLFSEEPVHIGNDPRAYTVEEMCVDALERLSNWNQHPTAHLYKSFIDRNNYIVDELITTLQDMGLAEDADYAERTYKIYLRLPKHIQIRNSLRANPLFDTLD